MKLTKILEDFETEKALFVGSCDRQKIKSDKNEKIWHKIIKNKFEVAEEEFLNNVDISEILTENETWEQYKEKNPDIKFYESGKFYFFQTETSDILFEK